MMVLTIPDGIDPIPIKHGRTLYAGQDYLCTNAFTGLMLLTRDKVTIDGQRWSFRALAKAYSIEFDRFDPDEDWNGKHVWLFRGGGYGDLIMLTPLIKELRRRWPYMRMHVAAADTYGVVLDGIDMIREQIPIPYSKNCQIDALIEFEEIVEGNPLAEKLNMTQLFANRAGITLTDLKPTYTLTTEERQWALKTYPTNHLPRIGIQLLASAYYRTYTNMTKVLVGLAKKAQVFLIGAPGQVELKEPIENVVNLMSDKLSFRQSVAVISTCNACVSPDSALVHVCSALDLPCVCLYGPFPSSLRITSPKAIVFEGKAECAPCFFHADLPDQFPTGMPCEEPRCCVALASIDPQRVVDAALAACG